MVTEFLMNMVAWINRIPYNFFFSEELGYLRKYLGFQDNY